jgi:hemerythrin-like metal-binding protein
MSKLRYLQKTVDVQHRSIRRFLDCLVADAYGGRVTERLLATIESLRDHCEEQFDVEEGLMLAAGFPLWREHQDEHQRFFALITHLVTQVERRASVDHIAQLAQGLEVWVSGHLRGSDRHLEEYLASSCPLAA